MLIFGFCIISLSFSWFVLFLRSDADQRTIIGSINSISFLRQAFFFIKFVFHQLCIGLVKWVVSVVRITVRVFAQKRFLLLNQMHFLFVWEKLMWNLTKCRSSFILNVTVLFDGHFRILLLWMVIWVFFLCFAGFTFIFFRFESQIQTPLVSALLSSFRKELLYFCHFHD